MCCRVVKLIAMAIVVLGIMCCGGSCTEYYQTADEQIYSIIASSVGIKDLSTIELVEQHDYDISRENAIDAGIGGLTEVINLPYEKVKCFETEAYFFSSIELDDWKEPVWLVLFRDESDQIVYKSLVAYDGCHIDICAYGEEFFRKKRIRKPLGSYEEELNEEGKHFYEWSVQEKAEFSQIWIGKVEEYQKQNPYYKGDDHSFWIWTRHRYGIPDQKAISQEKALQIAIQRVKSEFGEEVSGEQTYYFYDVTIPERPEWRLAVDTEFFVTIDPYTGEVLFTQKRSGKYYVLNYLLEEIHDNEL